MKYIGRKILGTASTIAIGYLIAQYFAGVWTNTHLLALVTCVAILIMLFLGRVIRRIIFWPINLIRKVLFRI